MTKRIAETISIVELLDMFSTEEKAVEWLEDLRWGGKHICPHCGCFERISVAKSKKFTYWCGDCRKHFTVKVGMVMESSKIPSNRYCCLALKRKNYLKNVCRRVKNLRRNGSWKRKTKIPNLIFF